MLTISLTSSVLVVHDSPRSLPESRRVEHDCYALIDSNVGSTIEDIGDRLDSMELLAGSDPESQMNAYNHLRYLLYNILNRQISPRALAFACLVESVDGVTWTDYSESGIEQLVQLLSAKGLSDAVIMAHWPTLRRKIRAELSESFPLHFPDNEAEQFALALEGLNLEVDELLEPDNNRLADRRASLHYEIQQMNRPAQLSGPGNTLKGLRNSYIENRVSLELEGLNVDDNTTSTKYWQYIVILNQRYKSKSSGAKASE